MLVNGSPPQASSSPAIAVAFPNQNAIAYNGITNVNANAPAGMPSPAPTATPTTQQQQQNQQQQHQYQPHLSTYSTLEGWADMGMNMGMGVGFGGPMSPMSPLQLQHQHQHHQHAFGFPPAEAGAQAGGLPAAAGQNGNRVYYHAPPSPSSSVWYDGSDSGFVPGAGNTATGDVGAASTSNNTLVTQQQQGVGASARQASQPQPPSQSHAVYPDMRQEDQYAFLSDGSAYLLQDYYPSLETTGER